MTSIITLATDFGLEDPYVAQMKGVILGISPGARIVDVTHAVHPQCTLQAVYLTQSAWPTFPTGSIHVAVVDPEVGTERRGLAVTTPAGHVVGPDNGVLSAALPEDARPKAGARPAPTPLPAGYQAFEVSETRFLRTPVSPTFHGRDVFAPAAAHLSIGVPADALGPAVAAILAFPPLRAPRGRDGSLQGRVLHIDRFGNVITDARAEDLPPGPFTVALGEHSIRGPARTYAQAGGMAALVGSGGYLEIALPNGSAADATGAGIGDAAVVRPGG